MAFGIGGDMFKKMYKALLITIILLKVTSYSIAAENSVDTSDWWHLINFRYSEVLGLNTNYTLQRGAFPLQITAGLGARGYKAGIGSGFGGLADNNRGGQCVPGVIGIGLKLSYLQTWNSNTNIDHHGKWIGIEATIAFILGIDIGFYKSTEGKDESLTTLNVGLFY